MSGGRYVGTGVGDWRRGLTTDRLAYKYIPSTDDRVMARDVAAAIAEKRAKNTRTGYGAKHEVRAAWLATGFLGEVAAMHPFGSGPEVAVWENGGGWYGRPDYGTRLEIRTTSTRQLYGFASSRYVKEPGLGGWRITSKDRGRVIVCVEDRGDSLLVMGWVEADDIPRLAEPLGADPRDHRAAGSARARRARRVRRRAGMRLIRVADDDVPTQCRHCGRFVRYSGTPYGGRAVWLDVDESRWCMPRLTHEPMPDEADLRLAVLEAMHPEEFRP